MNIQSEFAKVKELVDKANDIFIVTHEHPTFDSIGSSLALSLGLISLGKKVAVACPDSMTVELSSFVGVNKITSDISKKNFIISLDYVEGSIEKVSYNIEGNTFNLVIEPRAGFPPFASDNVHYSHAGGGGDLIIAIDTIHLGELGKLYEENKELFAGKTIVNIDHHQNNGQFGHVNIVSPASTTVELVGQLLQSLSINLSEDIATNLLNALYGGTNNFQNSSVAAFSLAASCMQAGGKRFHQSAEPRPAPVATRPTGFPLEQPYPKPPSSNPQPTSPASSTPADWLKPKIFKSSNLL